MENLEETLREMCCLGDVEKIKVLLDGGVNINSQNKLNGWTGLHWAAKRNHKQVACCLLHHGADPCIRTLKEELAIDLTQNEDIRQLLSNKQKDDTAEEGSSFISVTSDSQEMPPKLEFVPNYILNPQFPYSESATEFARRVGIPESTVRTTATSSGVFDKNHALNRCDTNETDCMERSTLEKDGHLVLKFRVAESNEKDFIEIELEREHLSFTALVDVCLMAFNVEKSKLKKIRKLPNTIVQNDRDVKRLKQFQEMEVVIE